MNKETGDLKAIVMAKTKQKEKSEHRLSCFLSSPPKTSKGCYNNADNEV